MQRMGLAQLPENIKQNRFNGPDQKPIWIHALSVGEVISALPLVKGIRNRFKNRNIVFSVSTKTGFETADKLLKKEITALFFFPYDLLFSVKYIAKKIDPAAVIIVESDIWPNYLFEMKRRKVPLFLVNARLSDRSFKGYRRFLFFSRPLFSMFSSICTQTGEDARRFELLEIPSGKIKVAGNLKFDQESPFIFEDGIKKTEEFMSIKPKQKVLLAGSTHKGEESILLAAFSKLKKDFSDLFMIVAPRDPKRSEAVCRLFKSSGFSACLFKDLSCPSANRRFDVIIIDTIGILRKLYAVSDLAFIGGSLVDMGGHNPLEPAAFSKPIIFGPYMNNFVQISELFLKSGGAVQVENVKSLYETASMLLSDDEKSRIMGEKAFNLFNQNKGAVGKILKVMTAGIAGGHDC